MQDLAERLSSLWPAMPAKLGERYPAFIEHGVQQATHLGLSRAVSVARYVNLWFVWGAAFEGKPGFDWAAGLLSAAPAREWNAVHQLVRRSVQELTQRPDARIPADALVAADASLLQAYAGLGGRGALHPAEPLPAPLAACDLQAAELRLLERAVTQAYELQPGGWQRVPLAEPAPLRVQAGQPLPPLVAMLAHAPGAVPGAVLGQGPVEGLGEAPATRLQARLSSLAVCDADAHPEVRLAGSHGLWRWRGHEARACSWPMVTLAQPAPAAGAGSALAEETSPDVLQLQFNTCGLRDEGLPLGALHTQLWVWPAAQWWLELQRRPPPAQPLVPTQPPAVRPHTRCKLERDGLAQETAHLSAAFESGLDAATAHALQALQAAWQRMPGLTAEPGEGVLALLVGRAAATWGWQLGAGGLDGRAFMRLVADLQLQAVVADWRLQGELALDASRTRITLRCQGQAALAGTVRKQAAEPPLLSLLPQLQTRFRLPLHCECEPLATDSGALLHANGAPTGALLGEAGLRPRLRGGSGLEWFASLRLEAVQLPVQLNDPLLGLHSRLLALLPAQTLLDWSLS